MHRRGLLNKSVVDSLMLNRRRFSSTILEVVRKNMTLASYINRPGKADVGGIVNRLQIIFVVGTRNFDN